MKTKEKKTKKKMSIGKKIAIVLMIPLVLVLLVVGVGYGVFSHYYNKLDHQALREDYEIVSQIDLEEEESEGEDSTIEEIAEMEDYLKQNAENNSYATKLNNKDVRNILLIGTDTRSNSIKGRSDSMIILSINSKTKQIVMTSIMRDIYVTIPGVGEDRINAAYAYGGAELLLDTIEANFKITLDEYVIINFYSFMTIVDKVGGVSIYVTADEIKVMQGYIREINKMRGLPEESGMLDESDAGLINLNGKQALAYSRVRYVGSDFARTERQRKVITAIFKKAKSMSFTKLNDLADTLLPKVTTNLSQGDVLIMMLYAKEYLDYEIVSCRIPAAKTYKSLRINGKSMIGIDFEKNREYWLESVYGTDE